MLERPGGPGRRPLPDGLKKRKHTIWISGLADRELASLRLPGETIGQTIERLITSALQRDDPGDRPAPATCSCCPWRRWTG